VKILIVDDDLDLSNMLSRFLQRHGFTVFAASDAIQGWEVLEREQVGMLITDLMMPHMDGIDFTERVRGDPRYRELPIILMTAYPSEALSDKGLRKGVAMTLSKPIDFERLLTLIGFAQ
jgi:DNA-binding response OmpR family regulator